MTDDNLLPFCFPAVGRKKVTAAFDGGRISPDGGVMLLAQADRRLGLAERLVRAIPDGRDPADAGRVRNRPGIPLSRDAQSALPTSRPRVGAERQGGAD